MLISTITYHLRSALCSLEQLAIGFTLQRCGTLFGYRIERNHFDLVVVIQQAPVFLQRLLHTAVDGIRIHLLGSERSVQQNCLGFRGWMMDDEYTIPLAGEGEDSTYDCINGVFFIDRHRFLHGKMVERQSTGLVRAQDVHVGHLLHSSQTGYNGLLFGQLTSTHGP